jgi:hypothetical protein
MSTRHEAGSVGTTIRPSPYWPWRSWYYREYEWGKKEPQMSVPEVRALLVHLLEVRVWDVDEILWWSHWRRERNRRAAASHRKRRRAERRRRRVRSRAREPAL